MSTETKYLVMEELIGIPAAAIEKAEEQASRIIQIVEGGWTPEEVDKVAFRTKSDPEAHPLESETAAYNPVTPSQEITGEDIAYLKDRGHTWQEIGITTGLTQDKARHLYRKWQKKQHKAEKSAWDDFKTVDEEIAALIASMDSQNALDIEILQAVQRQFPGASMTVADVRARRRKA